MSWNVEKFGTGKAVLTGSNPKADVELINFVNLVVRAKSADAVGMLELTAGEGKSVKRRLLQKLDNGIPATAGLHAEGDSQLASGGTQEEQVFVWKDQPSRLTPNASGCAAPALLLGVVDKMALSLLFEAERWTAAQSWATTGASVGTEEKFRQGRQALHDAGSAIGAGACQRS